MKLLADYTIDHSTLDWPGLLEHWAWLVSGEFKVWIMNRFGDLFIVRRDGTVHMLDVGRGSLNQLAASRDDCARLLDEPGNADGWLMIPLVDQLQSSGVKLGPGQCYSYRNLPVLGGAYSVDNMQVVTIAHHYKAFGPIHEKIRDLPDGTNVIFGTEG